MAAIEVKYQEPEIDFTMIDKIIRDEYGGNKENLIMMMQAIQKLYRYLPYSALRYLSNYLHIPITKIYEIATFYASFSLDPKGKHIISVCTGTACHLKGS
jgi:NADH:ubiquinone oxidoreductase subunit E